MTVSFDRNIVKNSRKAFFAIFSSNSVAYLLVCPNRVFIASLCTDFCDYPEKDGCPPGGSTCMQAGPSYDCTFMDYDAADTFVVKFTDSCVQKEQHMFVNSCMSDEAIGGICFFISFVMMYGSVSQNWIFSRATQNCPF